jgi:hypothetical protein
MPSEYFSLVVVDVQNWTGRPATIQESIQKKLDLLTANAAEAAKIRPAATRQTSRGDGAILGFPAEVPKEHITREFIAALVRGLTEHNQTCPDAEQIRLRMSLHAGDLLPGKDRWAGAGVVLACRLVDAQLLRRVLAAAPGAPLAVLASEDWYSAVMLNGYASPDGYRHVRIAEEKCDTTAWVRIPGVSRIPGLEPADDADEEPLDRHRKEPPPAIPPGAPAVHGNAIIGSDIDGDVTFGNSFKFNMP